VVRSRLQTAPGARNDRSFAGKHDAGPAASFQTKTEWSYGKEIAKTK